MDEPGQLHRLEMALDVTVTSKLGTADDKLSVLKALEDGKKGEYADMYDKIHIDAYGLAMDTAGNIGPNLLKLIEKCDEFRGVGWEDRKPTWLSWKCPTYKQAWITKFVVSMQMAAAAKINFAASAVVNKRQR